MSARGNLVLKDQAATPANHTFTPDGDDANGVHLFSEKTATPAGNPSISARLRRSTGKYRSSLRYAVPVTATQTINGVSSPVIIRTAYAEVNFTFDELSTDQERKDIVAYVRNSLATDQAMMYDLLVNLNDIY